MIVVPLSTEELAGDDRPCVPAWLVRRINAVHPEWDRTEAMPTDFGAELEQASKGRPQTSYCETKKRADLLPLDGFGGSEVDQIASATRGNEY